MWESYFEKRLDVQIVATLKGKRQLLTLWKEQGGLCPICHQKITQITGWHSHHILWRSKGGSDTAENRVLLHPTCHQQVHSQNIPVAKPRPLDNRRREFGLSEHARKRARAVLRGRDDGTSILLPDRSFTGWYRHITLVMLAHAFLAGICANTQNSTSSPREFHPCKASPEPNASLRTRLPLTIPEVRHLLGLLIWPTPGNMKRALAWSWWRRCHQSRASYYHTKRRRDQPANPGLLSHHPLFFVLHRARFPDFQDISCKSGSSGNILGNLIGRL
jgi:hypothetical protein